MHIEDRGSFFLVTIGEEAVARFVGQSVAVRNHKSTIDPYTLRNESDRRMEAPSVDARELKTIDIRAQSDTPQPFSPARGAEIPMRLVVKNSSDFPKKVRALPPIFRVYSTTSLIRTLKLYIFVPLSFFIP